MNCRMSHWSGYFGRHKGGRMTSIGANMGTASRVGHVGGPLWSMETWTRTLCVRQLTIFASRPVCVSSFPPPRHAAAIAFQRVSLPISLRQPSVRPIPRIPSPSHRHDRHYLGHRESFAPPRFVFHAHQRISPTLAATVAKHPPSMAG